MIVLGIESSCDETGVALVRARSATAGLEILSQALHTQVAMHEAYGGVVPELASRDHVRRLVPLLRSTLDDAGLELSDVDAVAYTRGPGLAGALLVGAGAACALAMATGKPTLGIHHLEGHLLSPFLADDAPSFPFLALLVSGGHTQLMHVRGVGRYEMLGETIDDAAGEAFDKCAKLLGLGYPGGPALARLAQRGDERAFKLPRPLAHDGTLDFSFAGLKTAVMTQWRRVTADDGQARGIEAREGLRADMAASVQAAIVDVLVGKTLSALERTGLEHVVVAGGVGANARLRARLAAVCEPRGVRVFHPPLELCTDNGAMIAAAGAMRIVHGVQAAREDYAFDVRPRWPLDELEGAGGTAEPVSRPLGASRLS
jgi:N6-L-threonylcarbamoyladenine synthase